MSGSTLDPDALPAGSERNVAPGHDTRTLGPSDSSDSGSDLDGPGLVDDDELPLDRGTNEDSDDAAGMPGLDSDSDRYGTGEATTAGKEPRRRGNSDVGTDRVVGEQEAGLGDGLDQAEEARLGITDEELAREAGLEKEPFEVEDERGSKGR